LTSLGPLFLVVLRRPKGGDGVGLVVVMLLACQIVCKLQRLETRLDASRAFFHGLCGQEGGGGRLSIALSGFLLPYRTRSLYK
jgi:hypothetical protein